MSTALAPTIREQVMRQQHYREQARETVRPARVETHTPARSEASPDEKPVTVAAAFQKKRRKSDVKFAALEESAHELRVERARMQSKENEPQLDDQDVQLEAHELIERAARKLGMSNSGLATHFYRTVPNDVKERWLYGAGGHKKTRAQIKFAILMRVRDQFRNRGGLIPRKKELAEAAAGPLGMTLNSARTYIYERLTPEEVEALDLRDRFLTLPEQIEILRSVRREMKEKGLPAPRHLDLAEAAAPLLNQKVDSVRTLIGSLSKETKRELEFLGSRSSVFAGVTPDRIRAGFVGAVAVLNLRRLPLTSTNLRDVLKLKPAVIASYLSENPDVRALLEDEE